MSATKPPQQERSQRRRDALVGAAVELIAEGGVRSITHRAVAARAGLPASTVGYFFASIDDLAVEALHVHVRRTTDDFLGLIGSATDAEELLHAVGHLAVDPQVELSQVSLHLEASRNPAMREPVAQAAEAYRQVTEDLLRAVGLPAAVAASPAFVALFQGFMLQHLAKPDDPPTPGQLVDALRALLIGYLVTEDERREILLRLRG